MRLVLPLVFLMTSALGFATLGFAGANLATDQEANFVAGHLVELNDNGAWSWFMDERAIVQDGKLIVGSIRAVGRFRSKTSDYNGGNIEVSVYDIAKGTTKKTVLHPRFEQDDHNSPAFLELPSKRILAMYSKHGQENRIYYRFSEPNDPLAWGEVREVVTPGESKSPSSVDNTTYNNLFRLSTGRIINCFRGIGQDPNYIVSDDDGQSWKYGGRLLLGKGGYSPYMRYAFDGKDTIHFVATEDHSCNMYTNSVFHGYLRDGRLHFSDGKVLGPVSTTTDTPFATWDLTEVFAGDPDDVNWIHDVKLDGHGNPHVIFSAKKESMGHGRGEGGMDIRFYYGRWNGGSWETHEMAHAGSRPYSGEDDSTGLASFDRNNLNVVYTSTNANPATGKPLISAADKRRHHELFRGTTSDAGKTWQWEPITANSTVDNLRPIVPAWQDTRTALVWMRGGYNNNRGEWTTAVAATILAPITK